VGTLKTQVAGTAVQGGHTADQWLRGGVEKLDRTVGGPARRNAVLMLAFLLSLDSADQGAIGAVAPYLEPDLHISNVQLGLLVTITSLVGVVLTVPMGVLVDRFNRTRLLMVMVCLWGVAELVSAFATTYWWLVVFRVMLGGVTAVAAPAVASLTGDYFPPGDRGRIYGTIVAGELLGAGFGVLVAGELAALAGWRPALAVLALPSIALAWVLHRMPEPARGGQSWIPRGAEAIASAEDVERGERPEGAGDPLPTPEDGGGSGTSPAVDADNAEVAENDVLEKVEEQGYEPAEEIVLDEDPSSISLGAAVRYVLKVRTNVITVVASSLGYFFFAGLKVFALLYVRGHYGVSQSLATILVVIVGFAALVGVLVGGRQSDRLIGRGHVTARIDVGLVGYTLAALLLAPALVLTSIGPALVLIMIAAAGIAAPNATLDAARLDVVPAQLWGRAESIRTALRAGLEAFAPLLFGYLSIWLGGHGSTGFAVAASGTKAPATTSAAVAGLGNAFLLMLVPLAASGIALWWARRAYPVDVASAGETQRRMSAAAERDRRRVSERHGRGGDAGDDGAGDDGAGDDGAGDDRAPDDRAGDERAAAGPGRGLPAPLRAARSAAGSRT
jgi:MFS family permease